MKTTTKTIKGWANLPNSSFKANFEKYEEENLQGFRKLKMNERLIMKNISEKIVIKAWYWRNTWTGGTKETFAIYYR